MFSSVESLSHVQLFATPWTAACQASLSFIISWSVLTLMSTDSVMLSNHLILCHPLLLLPSTFPSIRVFSSESALHIRWQSIGASASASVLPMNMQGWFPLGLTGWISLQSKGLSRVFSNTTIQKHQFFGTQPSLWSSSHICTWVLGKPELSLCWPLSLASLLNLYFLGFHDPNFPGIHSSFWPPHSLLCWICLLPAPWMCWSLMLFSSLSFYCLFLDNLVYSYNFIYQSTDDSLVHIFPSWPFSWAPDPWRQLPCGHLSMDVLQHLRVSMSQTGPLICSPRSALPVFPIPINGIHGHLVAPTRKIGVILHSFLALNPV